jgi:hypothetical protein
MKKLGLIMNFESRGDKGPSLLFALNPLDHISDLGMPPLRGRVCFGSADNFRRAPQPHLSSQY